MFGLRRFSGLLALLPLLLVLGAPVASAKCGDPPKSKVDWSRCQKSMLILRDADLSNGRFQRTNLSATDLAEANLSGAFLEGANLMRARLRGADLTGADLTKVQGARSDFREANLSGAILVKAEMSRADLSGADLTNANLSKSELERTILTNATLRGANLQFADLARTDFRGADLSGADLRGAYSLLTRLQGTDLSQTLGLTQDQLEIACGDEDTRLPEGLQRPESWPCGSGD